MYTCVFKGAAVIDGSGAPPRRADVAVSGNTIAAVEDGIAAADKVVDADGLVLAPGFIDIHSHTDTTLFKYPLVESKVLQGVTLEVTGNCGLGVFPVEEMRRDELADYLRMHDFALPAQGLAWHDFASYADTIDSARLSIHQAPLVGHAALRTAAMGMDNRAPSAAEMQRMCDLLAEALRQGAWGMSTGLIYPPGSYARPPELAALAKVLARHEALYASHLRNEGDELMEALEEAIALGRESGVRVQVSHLKAMGAKNRGRGKDALARIAAARREGIDVAADQYPYHASATTLAAVVPQWAHEGGVGALLQRFDSSELRQRLTAEIGRQMAAREGAAGIMVTNCLTQENRALSGRTVEQIAHLWGCTPEAAVIRLIQEERGGVGAIFFSMAEEDVTGILSDPQVAVGSDGHGLNAEGAAAESTHPRSYGTFPRVLGRYVRERKVLSLEAAIHKMTGLPAARLGLKDRGLVRPGLAADLVLFDPATIIDRADYADPHRYAEGVVQVLVHGEAVVEDGRLTGRRPGRVLRRR